MPTGLSDRAIVPRTRLVERLRAEAGRRITIVAAPAGYGKSVLLHEYLRQTEGVFVSYRVRPVNASALGFVRGLLEALGTAGVAAPLIDFVHSNGTRNKSRLREWFLDVLARFAGVIVVDDLHVATASRGVADFVARIVDESPPSVRWILGTRSLARLPVASWVARGEVGTVVTEADLSLTPDESAAISRACGLEGDAALLDHVAALAKGWPTAFSFGARLAASGYAPRGVTRHTSAFVYQLLAEQVFETLRPDERDFLFDTCLLQSIDPQSLARYMRADAVYIVTLLQQHVAFISPDGGGGFAYHDLFKQYLKAEFLKLPAAEVNARIRRACEFLVQTGDYEAAIELCVEMDAHEAGAEVLERVGFDLIDGGYVDVVERATINLRESVRGYPVAVALGACVESAQGNYVRADELYLEAIDRTGGDLQRVAKLRYAVDLLNRREFGKAQRVLASIDLGGCERPDIVAGALAVRAFAAAQRSEDEPARADIERALELTGDLSNHRAVAITHHRAALVYYALSELGRARALALSAVQLADKSAVAGLAARARMSLAIIAGEQGDLETHNRLYGELTELARAASDRNLLFVALMDAFWAQVEAGNVAACAGLERELQQFDATPFRRSEDTLLSAYALRSAWDGDFATAHGYVTGTADALTTAPRRALRHAETAVYAAAAGLSSEARAACERAAESLATLAVSPARSLSRTLLARTFLALAYATSNDAAAAEEVLAPVTFASGVQRKNFAAFVDAAGAFVRFRRGDPAALGPALGRLRTTLIAGYAPMIEQLRALAEERSGELTALSVAERAVLAHVERGLSSKEIAAAMARSPQTIDTHVKSILRKLNCRGRSEAAYVARRNGLLE